TVRDMLGLADRTKVIELFELLVRGDIASAFREFRDQYDTGADPVVILSDLAEFTNFVTRVKIVPAIADNVAFGETERMRAREFAAKLSMRVLSRMWQMLLKGIAEVQAATRPAAAAEMVLVRIAYVADMPTPDAALRLIEQVGVTPLAGADAGQRYLAQAGAMDRTPLDRDRVQRTRTADAAVAERSCKEPARARCRGRSAGAGGAGAISRRQGGRGAQACPGPAGIRYNRG